MKKTVTLLAVLGALAAAPAFAHEIDHNADTNDSDMQTNTMHTDMHHGDMGAGWMIKKMDTNGDGKISAEEHAAFAAKMFKDADTNHDGYLTKDEITAFHQKQRAMWASKTHHGIGHKGSAADTNNTAPTDANPHPTKDRQDADY